MISSFQDQTSDASGFASERSRTCLDYEASGVPPAQGQSGPWVFLNGFFLTDFSERKEKQPNLKGMVYFVSWIFWPPKSYVCWVVLLSLPKKNLSSRPFLECFFDMFYWISLVWVYDIVARSYAEKITPLAWGNATETWSTCDTSLRHGGYIVTETQAREKKKLSQWMIFFGHETICKPI